MTTTTQQANNTAEAKETAKTSANYTPEMEQKIVKRMADVKSYADQVEAVLELSAMLNKNVRSVTAKLSNMARSGGQVQFFKKDKTDKTGAPVQKKGEKVAELEKLTGAQSLESLEKANKGDLQILINALTEAKAGNEESTEA